MSYYLADHNGYLADVASIGGWNDFCAWAETQGGVIAQIAEQGYVDDPTALAHALAVVVAKGEGVEDTKEGLREAAARADGILIVSDGETSLDNEDDKHYEAIVKAAQSEHEPDLQRALEHAWKAARASVSMADLRADVHSKSYAKIASLLVSTRQRHMKTAMLPRLASAFMRGVEHGSKPLRRLGVQVRAPQVSVSLNKVNQEALKWANQRVIELANTPKAVEALVEDIVNEGLEEGMEADEIAALIAQIIPLDMRRSVAVQHYIETLRSDGVKAAERELKVAAYTAELIQSRAETIARTEVIMATNAGQQEVWEQAASKHLLDNMQRIWLADPDCCDECSDLADNDPVDITEPFEGGIMFPPLHPNCRCAMGLTNGEVDVEDDDE